MYKNDIHEVMQVACFTPQQVHPAIMFELMQAETPSMKYTGKGDEHVWNATDLEVLLQSDAPIGEVVSLPWFKKAVEDLEEVVNRSGWFRIIHPNGWYVAPKSAVVFDEDENGNMVLACNDYSELEDLVQMYPDDAELLNALLESAGMRGNGWEALGGVNSIPPIGLTEAPVLATDIEYSDEEEDMIEGFKGWYYPDYMINNFGKEIMENGFVVFTKITD